MRAVQAARNQVAKQRLAEINPKFQAGANELEKEGQLKILQPTNAEQLKQITTLVETLRRQNQHDQGWQNALRFWQMQITTGTLSDQVKFEFVRRFYFWLLGRGTEADVGRTTWGRANVAVVNREVALYIEQFSQRRLDYALQLSLLALRVPNTLNGYYLYFKYIVNGKLERAYDNSGGSWWELSNDDYLQDFELFQQEFDGPADRANYKDVIKPAATRPGNAKPFDASRPYPSDLHANEQNKHVAKTNDQLVAGVLVQDNEAPNEELSQAMDTDEDNAKQPPVSVPQPNAPPVPVNLPAMGVAPNAETAAAREAYRMQQQQSTATIGKLREELHQMKNKHSEETRTALGNMMGQVREEAAKIKREYDRRLEEHRRGGDAFTESLSTLKAENAKLQEMMNMMKQQAKRQPTNENIHSAASETRRSQIHVQAAQKFLGEPHGFPFSPPEEMSKLFHKATTSDKRNAKKAHAEIASEFASAVGEKTADVMAAAAEQMDTTAEVEAEADATHFADPTPVDEHAARLRRLSHELFVAHNTTKQEAERGGFAQAEATIKQAAIAREIAAGAKAATQIINDEARRKATAEAAQAFDRQVQEDAFKLEQARNAETRVLKKVRKAAAIARKQARKLQKEEQTKQKLAAEVYSDLTEAEVAEDARDEDVGKRKLSEDEAENDVDKAARIATETATEEDTPEKRAELEAALLPTTETGTEEDTPEQAAILDRAVKLRREKEKLKQKLATARKATDAKFERERQEAEAVVARLAREMDEGGRLRSEAQQRLQHVDPQSSGGDESDAEWSQRKKLQQTTFKAKQLGLNLKMPRHAPNTRKQAKELIKGIRDQIVHAQMRTFRTRMLHSRRKK
jgi:hypothetical protein